MSKLRGYVREVVLCDGDTVELDLLKEQTCLQNTVAEGGDIP